MDEMGELIPFWRKRGIIPAPKMPADRVCSGLLLSLIVRTVHKKSASFEEAYKKIRALIERIICCDYLSIDISECSRRKGEIRIDILAEDTQPYGYTLFVPKSWFTIEQ